MFIESTVRTKKLHCSKCGNNISKGGDVIFELNSRRKMENVFCESCSPDFLPDVIENSMHPQDSHSLGQD